MEKITLLNELNAIGEKLGYPFYLFADGSYGSKLVNGKMNAIAVIKKPFDEITLHKAPNCTVSHEMSEDETEKISVLPKTPEEAMAKLPVDKRKALQRAILLARAGELSVTGLCEAEILFCKYAGSDDIIHFLTTCPYYRTRLCEPHFKYLLSNPFVDLKFLKEYLLKYKNEVFSALNTEDFTRKNSPKSSLGASTMMEIRWDFALWFMLTFVDKKRLNWSVQCDMEYYFVYRCIQKDDLSLVEQYVQYKTSLSREATELLADKAAKDTKFYHWYMDIYLPLVQEA